MCNNIYVHGLTSSARIQYLCYLLSTPVGDIYSITVSTFLFVVLTFNIISVIYFSHSFVVRNTTKLEQNSTKTVTPPTNETADILKSFVSTQ